MWGLRCGFQAASSKRNSSMIPLSRAWGTLPCRSAPTMCIRTSDDELPPSTCRSWIKTTWAPYLAAASAAGTPAAPPPATTTSALSRCSVSCTVPSRATRHSSLGSGIHPRAHNRGDALAAADAVVGTHLVHLDVQLSLLVQAVLAVPGA